MATQTQFYLVDSAPDRRIQLPTGYFASWNNTAETSKSGANARATASTNNSSTVTITGATTTALKVALAQFCTPPLAAQSIGAGNWTIAFAHQANVAFSGTSRGHMAIYLINGGDGSIRTTILALADVGGTHSYSAMKTAYSTTIAGGAFDPQYGDYVLFEIGVNKQSAGNSTSKLAYNGATAISADNATNTTPASFISSPSALTLADPIADTHLLRQKYQHILVR